MFHLSVCLASEDGNIQVTAGINVLQRTCFILMYLLSRQAYFNI